MLYKNPETNNFFSALSTFLNEKVTPIAHQLDSDPILLKKTHQKLVALGDLRLLVPHDCGGMGGEREERVAYNILIAEYSGVLSFLHRQHQHSVIQLKKLLPNQQVATILRVSVANHQGMALGLAAGKNIFTVKPAHEGFIVSGQLPWVTGFDYFPHVLFSFDYDDTIFFTLLPFKAISLPNNRITISAPIETTIFGAANTVSVQLDHWFIADSDIIATQPLSAKNPSEHPSVYSFAGAAKALLSLAKKGKYAEVPTVKTALHELMKQWEQYYNLIIAGEVCFLTLRTAGLNLAEKCASLARLACGNNALLINHPVSRLSREIWQYAIAGLSLAQLDAYFEQIQKHAADTGFSPVYYDLSTSINEHTVLFPGDPVYKATSCRSLEQGQNFNLSRIEMGNHTGTHIDFPAHVITKGKTSSDYGVNDLIGNGLIIHVPNNVRSIDANLVQANKSKIEYSSFVFFKTANSAILKTGAPAENYVYIEPEAAKALLSMKVKVVGIDYISVDRLDAEDLPVHKILLSQGILIVENLNLQDMIPGKCKIFIMPLHIPNMDGLPARVIAEVRR